MAFWSTPEEKKAHQDWLDGLKAGDRVAVNGRGGYSSAVLTKVHRGKRTRFDTQHRSFNENGDWTGDRYYSENIEPITDTIREGWRRNRLLRSIREFKLEDATTEHLHQIAVAMYLVWPPPKPPAPVPAVSLDKKGP